VLRRAGKEIVRVFHNELIHGIALSDQDGKAAACSASCSACLLPGTGNGSRITHHDACLQVADVDAQFEGIRTYHPHDAAFTETLFDLPPEVGKVATAVTGHIVVIFGDFAFERILEVLGEHLHIKPACGEGNGLYPVIYEVARYGTCRG